MKSLRPLLQERLDPLDRWDPALVADRSDFDLNPELRPNDKRLLRDAAVLVPLVEREAGLSVILTRRTDTLSKHAGQIAFPGGRLDPGEGPVEAALREAHEEIGLDPAFVEPIGLSTRYETVTGYVVTPVVGFVSPGFTLHANPAEVAEVFETPFAFLMDPANHQRRFYETEAGARRYFYAVPYEERFIWGATAGMLRALWDRLYADKAA
ncbi:MAG TPA: CoA pyrophosphatase [Caulobacteraceae bacterium]|nr:CoA pyrophosphatase [Caulobacteraceae bacterium]